MFGELGSESPRRTTHERRHIRETLREERLLGLGADHTDDITPKVLTDLESRAADTACGRVDEDARACACGTELNKPVPCREPLNQQRCRLAEAPIVGNLSDVWLAACDRRPVGSEAAEAVDAIAGGVLARLVPNSEHLTRELEPWAEGAASALVEYSVGRRVKAEAAEDVGVVEADRTDADEDLIGRESRCRRLDHAQRIHSA